MLAIVPLPGDPAADDHIAPRTIEVASTISLLAEIDTGRHVQQVADRRAAVLAALEAGDIGLWRIIDRFDRTVGNRETDQYSGDRLDHRLG
jgi:hypothetical protein